MSRQLSIRNVPEDVAKRLTELSRDQGKSVNTLVLEILGEAVGVDERRTRLQRYVTWSREDAEEFDAALRAQRVIDEDLWR